MWATTIVQLVMALTGIGSMVILLALAVGQTLPSAGAIAFFWYRDGISDIYVTDIDRGTLSNLTKSGTVTINFTISADGRRLAYETFQADGSADIFTLDLECENLFARCKGPRQLTTNQGGIQAPVWSPDGRWVAYWTALTPGESQIRALDLETGHSYQLFAPTNTVLPLAWSPDSRQVALVIYDGSIFSVYTLEGNDRHLVTKLPQLNNSLYWSPDGRQMIYTLSSVTGTTETYLISAQGSEPRLLPASTDYSGVNLDWSPDSELVAFCRSAIDGTSTLDVTDIADGSTYLIDIGNLACLSVAWSPDGTQIAFVGYDGQAFGLYVVDREGQALGSLVYGQIAAPVWWP